MGFIIAVLMALFILGYAFNVQDWDMWKDPKWETIFSEKTTAQIGNFFNTSSKSGLVIIKVSTALKKKKFKCSFYDGKEYYSLEPDFVFLNLDEAKEVMIKNGYKLFN